MSVQEITKRLQELEGVDKASLSLEQRNEIADLYEAVLLKEFTPTSCNDCYHDAVIEMLCYIRKHGDVKHPQAYRLKNGALLQDGFGTGVFYTPDTLTDEKARELLLRDKSLLSLFARVPKDWDQEPAVNAVEAEEMAKAEPVKVKRTRKRKSSK